jgi:glucose/arabinose dehydrogenase
MSIFITFKNTISIIEIILTVSYLILFMITVTFLIYLSVANYDYHFAQAQIDIVFLNTFDSTVKIVNSSDAKIKDPSLNIEAVFKGIRFPTSMAFLGPDDILVLEKNQGTVKRILNGNMLNEPLLDVNVANSKERGMLGIAISKQESKVRDKPIIYVFLYYTETKSKDGEDLPGGVTLGNRLYRYELVNNKLINPKLLLDLPVEPVGEGLGEHQGGVVLIGPDKNVYLVIGDVNQYQQAQNILDGKEPNGTSGMLRITQDGKPVGNGILGDTYPLNLYYAYGIRNSFGMDFDPVTGKLWDTENGLNCCDEINLVEPGFNSGWAKVQGLVELNQSNRLNPVGIFNETLDREKLVNFGKGNYSTPEFIWYYPVGPSAIKFLNSDKLGKQYENDIFVGNVNHANLYHFDLTENRTELLLKGNMTKNIVESREDPEDIVFAEGLGRITDIDIGPDGNLYVLSHTWDINNQYLQMGSIYKISKLVEKAENATVEQETWTNYAGPTLSVSMETDNPISGNGSLRVDIMPAATVEEAVNSSWSLISSGFVPVKENAFYNYSLDVSAKDVNQLHSKVKYYYSNRSEIKEDFIFGGKDGTFEKGFSNSFLSPERTEYIKIQMLTKQSHGKPSIYLIDNVTLEEKKFSAG